MRVIKWGGIVVFVAMLVGMIVGVARSDNWRVERSVVITATPAQIHPYLVDFDEGWARWWAWRKADASAKWQFGGEPGRPGHFMTWDGPKIGHGKQILTQADVMTGIDCEVSLESDTPNVTRTIRFTNEGWATRVTWRDDGVLARGLGGPSRVSMTDTFGEQVEKSLQNLKDVVETSVKSADAR